METADQNQQYLGSNKTCYMMWDIEMVSISIRLITVAVKTGLKSDVNLSIMLTDHDKADK